MLRVVMCINGNLAPIMSWSSWWYCIHKLVLVVFFQILIDLRWVVGLRSIFCNLKIVLNTIYCLELESN